MKEFANGLVDDADDDDDDDDNFSYRNRLFQILAHYVL
jgi:hypothetical protein